MENLALTDLLKMMHTKRASDIHLKSDAKPVFRIKGDIIRLNLPALTGKHLRKMIYDVMTEQEIQRFEQDGNLDKAVGIPRVGRFRLNIFMQRGLIGLVGRRISFFIPDFETLNLPPAVGGIADFLNGLVLVTGPTGSGKSNTLAALVNHINKTRQCHILCIEDPIEFLYQDEQAIINQREIGLDVKSFQDALKYAMREDPDVILVGEIRDEETVKFAISGAETGHLIFGTMHSSSAVQTVQRILSFFPPDRHEEIRKGLSSHLRAVVSQMLLPACKEGVSVVPACEIMFNSPTISRLIFEGQYEKLLRGINAGKADGMQDFEQALVNLVNSQFITEETALSFAENPQSLSMKLKGIVLNEGGGIVA